MRSRLVLGAVLWLTIAGAHVCWAQSVASGTIHGTVKDETGGALPGVAATLTSASLQVSQLTTVTDAQGDYRFVNLPAGLYRLKFELSGFTTVVRDELRLTVGFVARIDGAMKVGALEEAVTVSGQSPVVDVSSTSASVAFTREVLDAVPRGRDLQNVFAMAPGVTQATPDVGGSKDFSIGGGRQLGVEADVFNLLNSNARTAATFASGPTFGYAGAVLPARIARVGARFRF